MSSLQTLLFTHIREKLAPNLSMADVLAETLCISTDSAYRRIRGEKSLSIDELGRLATEFDISIDGLLGKAHENKVTFRYPEVSYRKDTLDGFFDSIQADLEEIVRVGNARIIYSANDISFFHVLQVPLIAAFKSFFWQKTTYGFPELEGIKFDSSLTEGYYTAQMRSILRSFLKIPTVEILNAGLIDSTLNQIRFYHESGYLAGRPVLMQLYKALHTLIGHLKAQAATGKQFAYQAHGEDTGSSYQLYHNEVILTDNLISVEAGGHLSTYITFNAINLLSTGDQAFSQSVKCYLETLTGKSVPISQVAEKERNKFFLQLAQKVDRAFEGLS